MNNFQISVIVTVYNLEKYISECLDSILIQKDINFEIICVNDASTDNSLQILNQYKAKDNRIKIINCEINAGLSTARNIGIKNAVGQYLYNIDGDDLLVPNALKTMYEICIKNDLDLLTFSAKAFYDNDCAREFGEENQYHRNYEYPGIWEGCELFCKLFKNNDKVTSNRCLYCLKREWFIQNDLYDINGLRYTDDSMFSIYMAANKAMCIKDELYLRRFRVGSAVTSPMKKYYLESMIVLFLTELDHWNKANFTNENNCIIEKYFIYRLKEIRAFYNVFKNDASETNYLKKHPAAEFLYKYFIQRIPLYLEEIDIDTINYIKQFENIILYGAGNIGNETADILEYYGIYNYEVTVSSIDHMEFFRGKKIICFSDMTKDIDKTIFIVAMSEKYHDTVLFNLKDKGYKNIITVRGKMI